MRSALDSSPYRGRPVHLRHARSAPVFYRSAMKGAAMHAPSARTRRILRHSAGPVAVLLAGLMVWQGSLATLTATTSNKGNSWTLAEPDKIELDLFTLSSTAMFSVEDLAPGKTGSKCIPVFARPDGAATEIRFYVSDVTGPEALTDNLTLKVAHSSDCDQPSSDAETEPQALSMIGTDYATGILPKRFPQGYSDPVVEYRITWHLDDDALTSEEVEELTGQQVSATFNWEMQTTP